MNSIPILHEDGRLKDCTVFILSTISGVDEALVSEAKILPASRNLLHFPWFNSSKGGGAMVLGKNIYFTANWFKDSQDSFCYGNGKPSATMNWLILLAHEVRHLRHAQTMGYNWASRSMYVLWFGLNYAWYRVGSKKPFTQCMPLEIDADLGRKALTTILSDYGEPHFEHPLVQAAHRNNEEDAKAWFDRNERYLSSVHHAVASL